MGNKAGHSAPSSSIKARGRPWRAGLAAGLLLTCSPAALHAEASNAELAREIAELKAQIREMRGAISANHAETRHAIAKVRAVAERQPTYVLPPPGPSVPVGAVPAFVTADKKLQFGAITITPGGFLAAESVFRSRTTQSDINTGYGNIPFDNSPLAHTNEYRLTARQSRLALLAEGAITPTMLAGGYAEFDFLGAGTTSNATDTNSYAPRIRNLYATLDSSDYGLHLLAGQSWSLMTLNSKGITPRNEVTPPTIDGQFLPGFTFARQAGVRLTKDFDRKLWLSLALEEAQTTFAGAPTCTGSVLTGAGGAPVTIPVGGVNAVCAATASGAGFAQYGQPYSFNHLPDVIGKVAYELTMGDRDIHLEAEGIYRNLYDRSAIGTAVAGVSMPGTGQTHNSTGYGIGGGLIVPVIPKRLDFQGTVLAGRGIGRYGAGLLSDATFNPDGSLRPIGEIQALAGLTLHATPSIDVYAFAGIEKERPAYFQTGFTPGAPTYFGYGIPNADNSGCNVEFATTATGGNACAGSMQTLFQITGGMWDKIYKGGFGEVRVGLQYSYTRRDLFTSQANGSNLVFSPKASDQFVFTSLRYYPFQ